MRRSSSTDHPRAVRAAVLAAAAAGTAALAVLVTAAVGAAPANDTQAGAVVLALAVPASADTTEATGDGAAEAPGCPFAVGATQGVWFRFTTPGSGIYTFDAKGSDYATVVVLLDGGTSFGGCSSVGTFARSMGQGLTVDVYVGRKAGATGGTTARLVVTGPAGGGTTTPTTTTTTPRPGVTTTDPEGEEGGGDEPDTEEPDGEGGAGRGTRAPSQSPPAATVEPGLRLEVAHVGQVLAVQTGKWSVKVTTKVQWLRGTRAIRKATRLTYTLVKADIGKRVSARVTATAANGKATVVVTPGVMVRR